MIITFILININTFIDCGEKEYYDAYNLLYEGDTYSDNNFLNKKSILTSEADLNEYLEFLDQIKWPNKHENNNYVNPTNNHDDFRTSYGDFDVCSRFPDPISCINIYDDSINCEIINGRIKEYVRKIYHEIIRYIKKYVTFSQQKAYVSRLNMIKNAVDMINECETDINDVFTDEIDVDYKCILRDLMQKYENRLKLDNEIYDKFSKDLDRKIESLQNYEKHKILRRNINCKFNLHFREFMDIYKYIKIVPELLLLGYASTQSNLKKIVIPFHLITLFLNHYKDNINKNRTFAIFLLKKAFSYTIKCSLDIIYILQIQDFASAENSSLFFFSCEFNCNQRGQIKSRMNYYNDHNRFFIEDDRIHYNIVLRLFLFQHFLYLKYKGTNDNDLKEFKFFIDSILSDKFGCFKNHFNRFLNMIKLN